MAALGSLLGWRRDPLRRPAAALYAAAVAAARTPALFVAGGVPDTVDGRFDSLCLFVLLLIERLRTLPEPGPALAQEVFDAMFRDMDLTLREMGVGDPSMAKRMKAMWNAFHGRAVAYRPALAAEDAAGLAAALGRNVWRGAPPPGAAEALAAQALAQSRHLAGQPLEAFRAGTAGFLPATAPSATTTTAAAP
jgi:cytochrome b pre-mRNA-processing protein 3